MLAATQNANEPVRNAPKLSNSDQQCESFCSASQFLAHSASVDSFVFAKASATQKEDRQLLHSLLMHFIVKCPCVFFVFGGAWPSTGRDVVRLSHIHSVKIKTTKVSSEESGQIFAN